MTDKEKKLIQNHFEGIMIQQDFTKRDAFGAIIYFKEKTDVRLHFWFDVVEIKIDCHRVNMNYAVYSIEELHDIFNLLIKHKKL